LTFWWKMAEEGRENVGGKKGKSQENSKNFINLF
jgi:hypothetical protein